MTLGDIALGYVYVAPADSLHVDGWLEGYVSRQMLVRNRPYYEAICGHRLADEAEADRGLAKAGILHR